MISRDWSALRITIILYLVALFIPINAYFFYSFVDNSSRDAEVVSKQGSIGALIERITVLGNAAEQASLIVKVDKAMVEIKPWFSEEDQAKFNIRAESLEAQYQNLETAWRQFETLLKSSETDREVLFRQSDVCWQRSQALLFVSSKIAKLKQSTMINMIYFSLAMSMLIILAAIYFVRVYIYLQEKKHAIYDLETKLFNRRYFDVELEKSCAYAKRNKRDLTVLCFTIKNTEQITDANKRAYLFKTVGGVFHTTVRQSDTAARHNGVTFMLILPETDGRNAEVLADRLLKNLANTESISGYPFEHRTIVFDYNKMQCDEFVSEIREMGNALLAANR